MKLSFNSPLMDFLTTTAQFVALNVIFILCCLPILTIGPAIAALYQVILREIRGEHGYIIRKFFQHFKEMFVQSFLTWVLFLLVVLILLYNLVFWNEFKGLFANIILVLLYIAFVITACTFIYVFPLMARFKNGTLRTMKNAFFIAFTNLRSTALLLLIHLLTAGILYLFAPSKVFMLLVGFSFIAYCNSYILNKVFKRYEPKDESKPDEKA